MTTEEAINALYGIRLDNFNLDDLYTKNKYDALTMAINALTAIEDIKWQADMYGDNFGVAECLKIIERHIGRKENEE